MKEELEKKYGLLTAIAMVVGIVIGSGVFFKAEKVLLATGGDLPLGILSWVLGGLVMIICAYNFAVMATRYEKVSGVVDYAEVMVGRKYGYYFAWFMAVIYFPAMTSVVAWVTARYTAVLLGWDIAGPQAMTLAGLYLIGSFTINAISPMLAGKFQVTTTVAKLIPLGLMAVVGTIYGLRNGVMIQNFTSGAIVEVSGNPLFTAVVGTCFAYEGWICATSINAELKDSKKNLPRALMFGSVFVVISCIGTLNGLMMACTRSFYAMANRGEGPASHIFSGVDKVTNMPTNSAIMGLFMASLWLTYFYGANLVETSWFGNFSFDSSELPIITIYLMYIPIFFMHIRKEKELPVLQRFIMPALGIGASLFMVLAAIVSLGEKIIYYGIIFLVAMVLGCLLKGKKKEEIL